MFRNYIKISWRNLVQHKSYSLINLVGLAVAMACCILIALYMREELSFDTFHEHSDRIAAVGSKSSFFGEMLSTPYPLADALAEEIPEVENAVRVNSTGTLNLSRDNQTFMELERGQYTEPAFFEIFSFDLARGDESTALDAPNSIVLTESSSRKLFGEENPIGQSLFWQQRDTVVSVQVTGIAEDLSPNSTITFDALVSYNTMQQSRRNPDSWNAYSFNTYALLQSAASFERMPDQLETLVENHYEPNDEGEYSQAFFAKPLTELHLSDLSNNSGFTGNRAYLYLFGSVALFILVIACANYINLATARASLRSKEVGVRKTLGARRMQVAWQFVGESMMLCMGAFVIGAAAAVLALPWFNQLFGTSLSWESSGVFLLPLFAASAVIGVAAGFYPSLYLSRFTPASVLRGQKTTGSANSLLRKTLVVGQFAIALVLIIGSLIVFQQLQYTQDKDLGFDGEQVVSVQMPNREAWNRRETIRSALAGHPGIVSLSVASGSPGRFNVRLGSRPEEISSEEQAETDESIMFAPAVVDYHFLDLLEIELLAGRNFSPEMGADEERSFILNASGAEQLGWTPEEAIGKPFTMGGIEGEVIGVTEDFHISSLHSEIEGVIIQMAESSNFYSGGSVLARLAPDQISSTLDDIKEEVMPFSPNASFDYDFLDERFDAMYRTEQRLGQIVSLFTFIAIVIACLGLYGLAAFSAERRIKEIGIRKVMGATIGSIVTLLSKDFLKLVLIGFVIAVPIAWYAMNEWLADFAYRIEIGPWVFVMAGVAAMLVALFTVSWQSVAAASANPVESLRSE